MKQTKFLNKLSKKTKTKIDKKILFSTKKIQKKEFSGPNSTQKRKRGANIFADVILFFFVFLLFCFFLDFFGSAFLNLGRREKKRERKKIEERER